MSSVYRNNHYVPVWYQKRFLPSGQQNKELFRLDLKPETVTDSRGGIHQKNAVRLLGFRHCFVDRDLYTTRFGVQESTEIEQLFFGAIDSKGHDAVEYFTNFAHPSVNGDAFQNMVIYMSAQKLRSPKGLGWLSRQVASTDRNAVLGFMIQLGQFHCAIWSECIWLIADASQSETKFIISDHPVTAYNRRCGPRSMWCRGYDDPDIGFHGTHTIFPLSLEKILILTNLSWVRNPYQSEVTVRPNPNPWRAAMFNFMEIQTLRHLSEQEVREINFIIKTRALRYIAAAREDWLYPDKHVSKAQWNVFGDGYLLMPDPRGVDFSGEIMIGYRDGTSTAFDPYGRRPWQPGFGRESKSRDEFETLHRFKGEFARLYGPYRRGRAFNHGDFENERDDDDFHQYHLSLEKKHARRHKK
jgi:Protein of unknown function (DUF4238)